MQSIGIRESGANAQKAIPKNSETSTPEFFTAITYQDFYQVLNIARVISLNKLKVVSTLNEIDLQDEPHLSSAPTDGW